MLLMLAMSVLAVDSWNLMTMAGTVGFSSIADIWTSVSKPSFDALRNVVINNASATLWYSVLLPVMGTPLAVLFGLPGLWLVRANAPAIKVRGPTKLEMEMISAGLNPRRVAGMRRR
jgi:hypothetical protein